MAGDGLGRRFGWLWAAFAVSTVGTWLAFDAFPLVAVLVLHAGPVAVSVLAAAGLAVAAVVAVPLGPWVEFRRKRPVMMAADLLRFAALLSVAGAYGLGVLTFAQLLIVSVIVGAADITFRAASGAYLKSLLRPDQLLIANGRFEATQWTATALGPPLGGLAIGVLGPVATVLADAGSYLLSSLGLGMIGGGEARPERPDAVRLRAGDLLDGWRYILGHRGLRRLFLNVVPVNALIMVSAPLLTVLMVGRLGFATWQYGLAFGVPCLGGLAGARLARPLVGRFGQRRVLLVSGVLRAVWPVGLAFVGHGTAGLLLVIGVEFGVITSCGVFNPVLATYRLEWTAAERVTRVLSAWTVSNKATTAAATALWGLLSGLVGPRIAIGTAGALLLITPLLLTRNALGERQDEPSPDPAPAGLDRA